MSGRFIHLGSPVNRQAPLNRGLVGWWLQLPQNRGGAKLFDIAGTNHGTLTSGPTWIGAQGRNGGSGALSFDGTNDYVSLASQPAITTTGTVAFWCYPRALDGAMINLGGPPDGANQLGIWVSDAAYKLWVFPTGTVSSQTIAQNTWSHVAVTWDGTTFNMYVNGVLDSNSFASGFSLSPSVTSQFAISNARSTSHIYNGNLDDIRMSNRALSASEVAALYQASRAGYPQELNWQSRPIVGTAAAAATAYSWWAWDQFSQALHHEGH